MTTTTRNTLGPAYISAEALYDNASALVGLLNAWSLLGRRPPVKISPEAQALIEHNIINARSALVAIERAIHPVEQEIL